MRCGKHPLPDFKAENQGEKPIEFGISADFDVESKVVIDNSNVHEQNFMALGNLTVDGEQQTNLFGANGANVSYDADQNTWTYSPLRYWQPGSYTFAAVMPHRITYQPSFSADNRLTLDFGVNGFNLAISQTDLMVAFDAQTVQSISAATQVGFNFEHQLALVVIKGAGLEPQTAIRIDKIEVYGNNSRTQGDMVFYQNGSSIVSEYDITGPTTSRDVYQTLTPPDDTSWILQSTASGAVPQYTTLVPGLLVFPEACEFSIIVTYSDYYGGGAGIQSTKTGTLSVDWERGMKYTYTFGVTLDDITFSEPTLSPWGDGGAVDTDIQM